jgi:plastocyanin
MNTRITTTIGSLLLAATTLVGCGSSGSNSSYTSPTSPSTPAAPTSTVPTPTSSTPTPDPTPAPNQAPAVADVVISIAGMNGPQSYSPATASVAAGQTVAFVNNDSIPHTATGSGFDTGTLAPGATSAPITMNTLGSFPYHCQFHPTMTGTLNVVAPPQPPY